MERAGQANLTRDAAQMAPNAKAGLAIVMNRPYGVAASVPKTGLL